MKTQISIKYAQSLVISKNIKSTINNPEIAASLVAEMMKYGYTASKSLMSALKTLSKSQLKSLYNDVIPAVRELKGADVSYRPMYPNFPTQVMNASDCELFMNAIIHYWTDGAWKPNFQKRLRKVKFEDIKFKEIGKISDKKFDDIFTRLVTSKDSISDFDKKTIEWFMDNRSFTIPPEMPFKETMCYVLGLLFERDIFISLPIKTATDVLRVITQINGGDISLAENTRFKSLPRKHRKMFCEILENVISLEDIKRHKNKWIRLFHTLHVGEYSNKLYKLATFARNGEHIASFAGNVQKAIDGGNIETAVALLKTRPSEFARRLDHLLRLPSRKKVFIASAFTEVMGDVPPRILLQLLGHLKTRHVDSDKKIVFPKGNTQKAIIIRNETPKLGKAILDELKSAIRNVLTNSFKSLAPLNKVWIDPMLKECPIPTQQRSASKSTYQVARGSKIPFSDGKSTLRFFIYWVGRDIDLSATMHDENFKRIGHVSYTELKNTKMDSYHSGDIVSAPNGACEFIDIGIEKALKSGARYIAMNVLVYSGPTFEEHSKVYTGWMTREHANSNEIFDAKTVEQKIDLKSKSKNSIPVIFDLKERKAIWVDLTTKSNSQCGGNNVENNRASIEEVLEAIIDKDNKVSLHELFTFHAKARGKIVKNKKSANTIYSMYEGITPYNIDVINAEYIG